MSRKTVAHESIIIINQKKKELAIFLAITLVVLIVLIAIPIRLMALSVIRINNEIEGKRRIKEQLDTKITNLTQLNTEYQLIREDLKDFMLVFPTQGDYSLFVANLDEICKANYFHLSSVSVALQRTTAGSGVNPFEVLNVWEVNMGITGRRSDLFDLLEDIESMPMYPTVNVVGYKNELTDVGFFNFNISIKIYGVSKPGMYVDI